MWVLAGGDFGPHLTTFMTDLQTCKLCCTLNERKELSILPEFQDKAGHVLTPRIT